EGFPIIRPYVGYRPADLDPRLASERGHRRRRIAAHDREAQFRNPSADLGPDLAREVGDRVDIRGIVHGTDENDPVAAPVLAGSVLSTQPARVGVLDLVVAVVAGVHSVFDYVEDGRRSARKQRLFVALADDQVGVADAQ